MKISTIIPTIFRPLGLVEAVDSILKQTRIPDELIIVDQSTDDKSKDAVNELFAERREAIELIYIHDNSFQSLVRAKEIGMQKSSGDIVSFLEDDVVLMFDYFENMEEGFIENPDMKGCSGVITHAPLWTVSYRFFFHLFHRGIFFDPRGNFHNKHGQSERVMYKSNYLSGGISAYKKEVFEKIGFDKCNDFHMFEDIEFSTRAAQLFGQQSFFINSGMRLDHNMSPINRASLGPRWRRKLRETLCFYKKRSGQVWALQYLLWLLVGACIEAVVSSFRLRNTGPIRGTIRGIAEGIFYQLEDVGVAHISDLEVVDSDCWDSGSSVVSPPQLKILFVHNGKAFLPELNAYVNYLQKKNYQINIVLDQEIIPPNEYDLVFRFSGLIKRIDGSNIPEIHEFNSASTPPWSNTKNIIKSILAPKPVGRIFLSDFVRSQFTFPYEAPFIYRDMGADSRIFSCRQSRHKHKIYDAVYAGSISGRPGFIETIEKISRMGLKVGVAGNATKAEIDCLKSLRGVDFIGLLEIDALVDFLASGTFGLNYCPDKYPYSQQTSTKVIEYLAGGLPIISNRYRWMNAHSSTYGYSFLDIDQLGSAKDLVESSEMVIDADIAINFEWERILDKSNFMDFIEKATL